MSWPIVKLGELCHKITDGSHNPPTGVAKSEFLMISSKNIFDDRITFDNPRYLSQEDYLNENKRTNVSENNILLTIVGTIGRVAVVTKEHPKFTLQRSVAVLKPITERIEPRFMMYSLRNMLDTLVASARGVAQKGIYLKQLQDLDIPLPPLEEQKRIAAILDKADAIRQKRQQAIEFTDEFLRAVFLDMFGEPVKNTKGWEFKYLKELSTKIHSGNTPTGGREVYVDKGIAFFRSQNVWKNKLELDDIAYLDHATHKKMAKSSLKNRDILMTKTGRINTENSSLGRAAMYLGEDDAANINGHVYLIRLKSPELNEFILYILTTKEYRNYIRSVCVGGIDKRQLNKDHLEQFPIINPPVELQKQFVKLLQIVESKKEKARQSFRESQKLFNTLSQKAFSGEL